jgi:hypothetical protein
MDDHRISDLLYGHLGEASYDPDEKSWSFSRELSQGGFNLSYFSAYLSPNFSSP